MNTKILIIYTGGTIGMVSTGENNKLKPNSLQNLLKYFKLSNLKVSGSNNMSIDFEGANIDCNLIESQYIIDSSNVNIGFWQNLAGIIYKNYKKYDGFVVLHGTDTMTYSASMLSFMFQNLNKPIILTGSQLPIDDPKTDAINNFYHSILIAAYRATSCPLVPEILICFGKKILRGNRAKKISSRDFEAFDSPNYPYLGIIKNNKIILNEKYILHSTKTKLVEVHTSISSQAIHLAWHPEFPVTVFKEICTSSDILGIVISAFGLGNLPQNFEMLQAMQNAIKYGKIIMVISQCQNGGIDQKIYQTSDFINQLGVINGLDMTTEAAITKMMYALALNINQPLEPLLSQNLRGELTQVG